LCIHNNIILNLTVRVIDYPVISKTRTEKRESYLTGNPTAALSAEARQLPYIEPAGFAREIFKFFPEKFPE
jgi:hypothetical protein